MIIHPLRFARRPCLRGTVSYCLLMQTRWHHESDAILFICADRVFLSSSVLSLFSLFVLCYFLGVQAVADVVFHDVYGLATD